MGQRLVINIIKDKTVLANAYYHWSGYTDEALNLVSKIIDDYRQNYWCIKTDLKGEQYIAIKLLEHTGSGILEEKMEKVQEDFNSFFNPSKDRNEGITAYDYDGYNQNQMWGETFVYIDLFNRTIKFHVFRKDDYENELYTAKSYMEEHIDKLIEYTDEIIEKSKEFNIPEEYYENIFDDSIDADDLHKTVAIWMIEKWKSNLKHHDNLPNKENISFANNEWDIFLSTLLEAEDDFISDDEIIFKIA